MHRRTLLLVPLVVLLFSWAPARAGSPQTSTTGRDPVPVESPNIIPEPDSGREPEDFGDRGGAGQLIVLGAVVVGIGIIVFLVRREVLRARRP